MPESLGRTPSGPADAAGAAPGENVSKTNIARGVFTARNKRTDQMTVRNPMRSYGYDIIERVDPVFRATPMTSLSRPSPADLHSHSKVTDKERLLDPTRSGCSFLHKFPRDLPKDVKVDVCSDLEREFLHPLKNFSKGKKKQAGKLHHIYREGPGVEGEAAQQ